MRTFALSGMFLVMGSCAIAGLWPAWCEDACVQNMPCSFQSQSPAQYVGSPGCSSQSCHGQSSNRPTGGERQTWIEQDPHAKSLSVLHNEDSARMIRLLRQSDPTRPPHAYQDASCLGCHAVSYAHGNTDQASTKLSEGVSCEACHGPAERWLTEHYLASWKTRAVEDKRKNFGFVSTKDLTTRIDQCTACHIGSASREVNHDLIAAGHPRLAFEYTRFHYAPHYGKHWTEQENNPEFEMRAWFIGQIASMRTVVSLLHARLEEKLTSEANHKSLSRPWPEFAEMSCYACHQTIGKQRPRSLSEKSSGPVARTPDWNPWYFSLVDVLRHQSASLFSGTPAPKLAALQELLQLMRTGHTQKQELAKLSAQAYDELTYWLKTVQHQKPDMSAAPRLLHDLATHALRNDDWDHATQHYLACAALVHACGEQSSPLGKEAKPLVQQLRLALKFPDDNGTIRVNSPREYDPQKTKHLFQELKRLTGEARSN